MLEQAQLDIIYLDMLGMVIRDTQRLSSEFDDDEGTEPDDVPAMASFTHLNYGEMMLNLAILECLYVQDAEVFVKNRTQIQEAMDDALAALESSGYLNSMKNFIGHENVVVKPDLSKDAPLNTNLFLSLVNVLKDADTRLPAPSRMAEQFNDVVAMGHYGMAISAQSALNFLGGTVDDVTLFAEYEKTGESLEMKSQPICTRQNMAWGATPMLTPARH